MTDEELAAIEARLQGLTPAPWFWNSYSEIQSGPLCQITDEPETPQYPESKRPGPPFFTDEDNAWLAQKNAAYLVDPTVAWVPAHHGDTATDNHAADALFIEHARDDVPALLAEIRRLRKLLGS